MPRDTQSRGRIVDISFRSAPAAKVRSSPVTTMHRTLTSVGKFTKGCDQGLSGGQIQGVSGFRSVELHQSDVISGVFNEDEWHFLPPWRFVDSARFGGENQPIDGHHSVRPGENGIEVDFRDFGVSDGELG